MVAKRLAEVTMACAHGLAANSLTERCILANNLKEQGSWEQHGCKWYRTDTVSSLAYSAWRDKI